MPRRLPLILGTAALAVAAAGPVAAGAGAATTTLTGTVGPGYVISLKGPSGSAVTHLKAGTYKIVVKDLSPIHDFHLSGPGVNKATAVGTKSTATWTVALKKGTYTYVCDPHMSIMHGKFTVS